MNACVYTGMNAHVCLSKGHLHKTAETVVSLHTYCSESFACVCIDFGVFLSYSPSYIFKLIFIYVYVFVPLYFLMHVGPHRGQKRPSDPMKLESQAIT